MSSEPLAICLRGVAKRYRVFDRPASRLAALVPGLRRLVRWHDIHSLHPLDLDIRAGEVVGLVGRNGAGKSTLLQLVCKTLPASSGTLEIAGKVSALLELGAGFNPEFTGRENVFMSAAILGLSRRETEARLDEIVAFADIGPFIDQPVKTYSSGMYIRLAFAVATAVEPDILVIDEALAVGDGAFARKSFERILSMKEAGKTILFCSHSLYQVEAMCSRVLWLDQGRVIEDGDPGTVVAHYQRFLDTGLMPGAFQTPPDPQGAAGEAAPGGRPTDAAPGGLHGPTALAAGDAAESEGPRGYARLSGVRVSVDGREGRDLAAVSGRSTLAIELAFESDPALPMPTAAATLSTADGHIVTSAATWEDGVPLQRDAQGRGRVRIVYEDLPLLRGRYRVGAYLFCENGIHSYGWIDPVAMVEVSQEGVARGYCRVPHHWVAEATP